PHQRQNFFSIRIKVRLDAPPSFCLPSLLYQLPGAKYALPDEAVVSTAQGIRIVSIMPINISFLVRIIPLHCCVSCDSSVPGFSLQLFLYRLIRPRD
ncbi:hypothetical protein CH063_06457, partial [Colletotrichum higginsianum]